MKLKLLEVLICIILGFFTGVMFAGTGRNVTDSGVEILLGCIFWILVFSYIRKK